MALDSTSLPAGSTFSQCPVSDSCIAKSFRTGGDSKFVSSLSSQYKIKRSVLYRWRDAYHEKGKAGFGQPRGPGPGAKRNAIAKPSRTPDERIVELERRLGRMAMENDCLRRAFKRVKEARSKSNAPGEARCTENAAGRQSRTLYSGRMRCRAY